MSIDEGEIKLVLNDEDEKNLFSNNSASGEFITSRPSLWEKQKNVLYAEGRYLQERL